MPSDRRSLAAALAALALFTVAGCRQEGAGASEAVPGRFAGVRKQAGSADAARTAFCERSYPAGGEGSRRYGPPPERPLPGSAVVTTSASGSGWTWVNLWATWCTPCVDEMELLGRWRDGFARDGTKLSFELVSIDATEQGQQLAAWRSRRLPGPIRWLRSEDDLGPFLESLGVARDAMIPVHALVDPSGWLRCVRVGAIHEQDYAVVRALLAR